MKKVMINIVLKDNGVVTERIDFPAFTIPASRIDQSKQRIRRMLNIPEEYDILFYIDELPDLSETESPT